MSSTFEAPEVVLLINVTKLYYSKGLVFDEKRLGCHQVTVVQVLLQD